MRRRDSGKLQLLKEHELHEGVWRDCWLMEAEA